MQQGWTTAAARALRRFAIAVSGALMIGVLPTAAQAQKAGATWNDNYTNTVTATKVTKAYPDHEKNIPEEVIASRMNSKESAQAVWANQNGKVTSYEGSVAAGKITVVVDFGHIKDTHVYVRNPK